jgi:hypothetical protein|nr:MAG TPA: hypothetical protein [Caudoviricetes sp.]
MTKECKVLLRNQYVMVVDFDGKEIQMPSDHTDKDTVFVKYENDRYSITCKLEKEKKHVSRVKKQKKVTEVELADDVTPEEQKDESE